MVGSINKVILVGNVGKDPVVRTMSNNADVASFSLATSETWKDKNNGERKEKTEWHNIVIFGGLTDVVRRYVQKGTKLYVEGSLQTRKWLDQKTNNERYTTEVVIHFNGNLVILNSNFSNNNAAVDSTPNEHNQYNDINNDINPDIPF